MKHIKLFENYDNTPKRNLWASDIDKEGNIKSRNAYKKLSEHIEVPTFPDRPEWKISDEWTGNNEEPNFAFANGTFEIMVEYWDPDDTYTIGFRELGDKYIVIGADRYQAVAKNNSKDVAEKVAEMMTFLDKYSK